AALTPACVGLSGVRHAWCDQNEDRWTGRRLGATFGRRRWGRRRARRCGRWDQVAPNVPLLFSAAEEADIAGGPHVQVFAVGGVERKRGPIGREFGIFFGSVEGDAEFAFAYREPRAGDALPPHLGLFVDDSLLVVVSRPGHEVFVGVGVEPG